MVSHKISIGLFFMHALTVIAAYSERTGVIGDNGRLPWPPLKTDFQFLKHITLERPSGIIMGRRTFESIGKPLPRRVSIVLTSQDRESESGSNYKVYYRKTLDQAISLCSELSLHPIIFGGYSVYEEALRKYTCKVYLTEVHKEYTGTAYFPVHLIDRKKLINITEEVVRKLEEAKNIEKTDKSTNEFTPQKDQLNRENLTTTNNPNESNIDHLTTNISYNNNPKKREDQKDIYKKKIISENGIEYSFMYGFFEVEK